MFAFRFVVIGPFLAELEQIPYLTMNIQGQGLGQGQIWWSHLGLRVQSICVFFVWWQSNHFWLSIIIANSIFNLENSRSWSHHKSRKIQINQKPGNLQLTVINPTENEGNQNSCSDVIVWTSLWTVAAATRTNRYKNIKPPPVYRSDLIKLEQYMEKGT